MTSRFLHLLLAVFVAFQVTPALAREGDTLNPIEIEAAPLVTYPDGLLAEGDFEAIDARVVEARISGAPLAVRIVDMTQDQSELPFPIRQYARDDFSQPFSEERKDTIAEAWAGNETIETSADADDGFLLLVLVPEDRTQTQVIWHAGENALPLNGLTEQNIQETLGVMNKEFSEGNMPNGLYLGVSEFSYNVQFGDPERLERSELGDALHVATIPLAIATTAAGIVIPLLAWRLARRNDNDDEIEQSITPWHAAALKLGRATPDITTAMLLDAVHTGAVTPGKGGTLQLHDANGNGAVEALRPFANNAGVVPAEAMLEVEAITAPARNQIENDLAESGAMTNRARVDSTWMLVLMGATALLAVMTAVPTVVSMSTWGAYAIVIALIGILAGWWWLTHRDLTSPAGETLMENWLKQASSDERRQFDSAVNLNLFTDQVGGPTVNPQTQLVRQLRGLSAG